jgi:putative transposase
MKKSRFTESKIISLLKEHEAGRSTQEICREHGISSATFYNWRKKYGGMDASQLKRLKELEEENARLKKMYADLALDNTMLKDVLSKKF